MNNRWYRKLFGIKVKQRFYPQCVNCSKKQSNILSDASRQVQIVLRKKKAFKKVPNLALSGGGKKAYVHGFRFRGEHLAGGLLAGATVSNAEEIDVLRGNQTRFRNWQLRFEDFLYSGLDYMSGKS